MEKKYLPTQLKKIVKDFRIEKDIDSCEFITKKGKRCKYATKYRSGDEIKDCGKYCKKNCKSWFGGLITSIFKGSLIANGEVRDKIHTSINMIDYDGVYHSINKLEDGKLDYLRSERGRVPVFSEIDNKNMDLFLDIFCKGLQNGLTLKIEIKMKDIGIINDLEIGGIRGWMVEHNKYEPRKVKFVKNLT